MRSERCIGKSRKGFTLVEMLVVIGIIAALIAASLGGYSKMIRAADKVKAQEQVTEIATALNALYQQNGVWPKRLAMKGGTDGEMDADVALVLAKSGFLSLSTVGEDDDMRLTGHDRLGIVTPWARDKIKSRGKSATEKDIVSGSATVKDHRLHFALDLDGDGIIKGAMVGGVSVDIRATAAVWSCGRDGIISPYSNGRTTSAQGGQRQTGGQSDDVYSWTVGQTKDVQ